jgi:hypothetical protein
MQWGGREVTEHRLEDDSADMSSTQQEQICQDLNPILGIEAEIVSSLIVRG